MDKSKLKLVLVLSVYYSFVAILAANYYHIKGTIDGRKYILENPPKPGTIIEPPKITRGNKVLWKFKGEPFIYQVPEEYKAKSLLAIDLRKGGPNPIPESRRMEILEEWEKVNGVEYIHVFCKRMDISESTLRRIIKQYKS